MEKTEMKKRRRAYKKYNWRLHAKMVQIADMLSHVFFQIFSIMEEEGKRE